MITSPYKTIVIYNICIIFMPNFVYIVIKIDLDCYVKHETFDLVIVVRLNDIIRLLLLIIRDQGQLHDSSAGS